METLKEDKVMEPTEESIIAELDKMNREWLDRFNCERLKAFVKVHPKWEDEFGVGDCLTNIPGEFQCSESDGEHPCSDCPLQPSVKVPLWTYGDEPQRKPKPFGFNSNARGPDMVNL